MCSRSPTPTPAQTCCSPCGRRWARADALTASDDVVEVAAALAAGALHGARGNSGVILSQILRGLADVTASAAADRAGCSPNRRRAVRLPRCGMRSAWSSPRWVKPFPARSSPCCRRRRTRPRMRGADELTGPPPSWRRPPTPRPSHSTRPPGNSTYWPRPVWSTPAAAVCWCCWTRCAATADRACAARRGVRAGSAAARRRPGASAPPQFEVMYQLGGCDAAGVETLRARLEELGESVAIAATAGAGHTRCTCTPTTPERPSRRPWPAARRAASRSTLSWRAGAAAGRWTRDRAVLAVVDGDGAESCSPARARTCCAAMRGGDGRQRQRTAARARRHGRRRR